MTLCLGAAKSSLARQGSLREGLFLTTTSRNTKCSARLCSRQEVSETTSGSPMDPQAVAPLPQEDRATSPMRMMMISTAKHSIILPCIKLTTNIQCLSVNLRRCNIRLLCNKPIYKFHLSVNIEIHKKTG